MNTLKFGIGGNAKLGKEIATFSILSGHSCPGANECYTKVIVDVEGKRKIVDGKNQKFRCFSASQEALYKNVYDSRLHNYNLILNIVKDKSLNKEGMVRTICNLFLNSLPGLHKWSILRLHVGGDIFCQEYFDALIELAKALPDKLFYAYTKSIHFWVKRLNNIPDNFKLTASYGGKYDSLIDNHKLKSVKVIMSEEEAEMYNLEIDHDDSHAYSGTDNFALLLHGSQQKGSVASKAKSALAKVGWNGYTNANNKSKKPKDMLNLIQYQDLKLYLISLFLNISDIKNIKSDFDKKITLYIEYLQNDIIFSDIKVLDKVTFDYEDIVYTCFKINQQSGNNLTKWICNCDNSVTINKIYNEINSFVMRDPISNINDEYILNKEYENILNSYRVDYDNDIIILDKLYDTGINKIYYDVISDNMKSEKYQNNKNDMFIKSCKLINVSPKPLLAKINNNHIDANRILITENSIDYTSLITYNFEYKIGDVVNMNDLLLTILDIKWNNVNKIWLYKLSNDNEKWLDSSEFKRVDNNKILFDYINVDTIHREDKETKIRPDLISPYFLETIGKLMRDNNSKYPEYNYTQLSDSSFYQSLWRHFVAFGEQRLMGISDEFDNNEDHLAAIAFNVMGLIHNRETAKFRK